MQCRDQNLLKKMFSNLFKMVFYKIHSLIFYPKDNIDIDTCHNRTFNNNLVLKDTNFVKNQNIEFVDMIFVRAEHLTNL